MKATPSRILFYDHDTGKYTQIDERDLPQDAVGVGTLGEKAEFTVFVSNLDAARKVIGDREAYVIVRKQK